MRIRDLKTVHIDDDPGLPEPVGAGVFGWSQSQNFHPALAPTPTLQLQYLKYFVFTRPKYDVKYDYDYKYDEDYKYSMNMSLWLWL